LLFFFAFSTLPVGTFLPPPLKKRIDAFLNTLYPSHRYKFLVLVVALVLISALYWNIVCKFFII
jgi:hypothetical protein